MNSKFILDACCGSRMFWFNKEHPGTMHIDNRELETELCDGRTLTIKPDMVADFRAMPFPDASFRLVVFDPPHLLRVGEQSWLAKKYGKLGQNWQEDISKGFQECLRVLENKGILIFKWNEDQIRVSDVLKLCPIKPLFGNKTSKNTHWIVFVKEVGK